jgi:hypothetical protein
MSLAFLYKANADLSFQMAAAAKTPEMRKKWTDLAVHWQTKATMGCQFVGTGTKHLDDGPSISPSLKTPEVSTRVENRGQDLAAPADQGIASLTPREKGTLAAIWTALQAEPTPSPSPALLVVERRAKSEQQAP